MERQKVCEELLILSSKSDSDVEMLQKSKWIVDGLDALGEKLCFKESKLINSVDQLFKTKDSAGREITINKEELKNALSSFVTINEFKRLQFKC